MNAIRTYPRWLFQVLAITVLMALRTCPGLAQVAVRTPPRASSPANLPVGVSGSVATQTSSGLTMTVDSLWLDGTGYRPIRITVIPAAAVTADRDLLVRVTSEQSCIRSNRSSSASNTFRFRPELRPGRRSRPRFPRRRRRCGANIRSKSSILRPPWAPFSSKGSSRA